MNRFIKHIPPFLFTIAAYILLPIKNNELLYTIEEHNLYIPSSVFCATEQIDFVQQIACYLTQFFHHPWLGASIIILMWVAIYYLICYSLHLRKGWSLFAIIPSVGLLSSYLCVGYWIYYLDTPGYFFSPTLYILATCVITSVARLITQLPQLRRFNVHSKVVTFLAVIITFVSSSELKNLRYTLPDPSFRTELTMHHALEEYRYEDVINEAMDFKEPSTNLMVMYKNIALLHTGRITEMFLTPNCGVNPTLPDGRTISINRIAGPLIYLQLGQVNFAQRCAMENSVLHGFDTESVKALALCALINKEFDLSYKYLTLLRQNKFQRPWAKQHIAMLTNSTQFFQSEEYTSIEPFFDYSPNTLDDDEGHCEKYILDYYSGLLTENPYLKDFVMCTALWTKADNDFMYHLHHYLQSHPADGMPLLYQQAAILYGSNDDAPQEFHNLPLDQMKVIVPYTEFATQFNNLNSQGLSTEQIAERLSPRFHNTYWWYYYFYTDFQIY